IAWLQGENYRRDTAWCFRKLLEREARLAEAELWDLNCTGYSRSYNERWAVDTLLMENADPERVKRAEAAAVPLLTELRQRAHDEVRRWHERINRRVDQMANAVSEPHDKATDSQTTCDSTNAAVLRQDSRELINFIATHFAKRALWQAKESRARVEL